MQIHHSGNVNGVGSMPGWAEKRMLSQELKNFALQLVSHPAQLSDLGFPSPL